VRDVTDGVRVAKPYGAVGVLPMSSDHPVTHRYGYESVSAPRMIVILIVAVTLFLIVMGLLGTL
jgi:hypothetical protein